jgi:hypothetical protein
MLALLVDESGLLFVFIDDFDEFFDVDEEVRRLPHHFDDLLECFALHQLRLQLMKNS